MKNLIIFLFLIIIGCRIKPNNTIEAKSDNTIETKSINLKNHWVNRVDGVTYDIFEIEIDGCRYIMIEGYGETLEVIHKENCKNIHS